MIKTEKNLVRRKIKISWIEITRPRALNSASALSLSPCCKTSFDNYLGLVTISLKARKTRPREHSFPLVDQIKLYNNIFFPSLPRQTLPLPTFLFFSFLQKACNAATFTFLFPSRSLLQRRQRHPASRRGVKGS